MRNSAIAISAGLLFWMLASISGRGHKDPEDGWLTDYEGAKILARKTGKPLLVVFRCEP
jgi:hypothetical protein